MIKCHHPGSGHKASVGLGQTMPAGAGCERGMPGRLAGPKVPRGWVARKSKTGKGTVSWHILAVAGLSGFHHISKYFLSSSLFNMIHHWSCQTILQSVAVDGSCFLGAMVGEKWRKHIDKFGPCKSQHYLNIGRAWLWCGGEIASAAEVGSWSHSLEEWWRFGVRKLERAQLVGVLSY